MSRDEDSESEDSQDRDSEGEQEEHQPRSNSSEGPAEKGPAAEDEETTQSPGTEDREEPAELIELSDEEDDGGPVQDPESGLRRSVRSRTEPVRLMYERLGVQAKASMVLAARESAWPEGTCFMAVQASAYN